LTWTCFGQMDCTRATKMFPPTNSLPYAKVVAGLPTRVGRRCDLVAGTPPPAEAKLPTVKNCCSGREIDPGQVIREWHNVGTTLHLQLLFRMVSAHAMDLCRLFDGQQCLRSELGRGCEANSNLASSWIQLNAVECTRLQSEP